MAKEQAKTAKAAKPRRAVVRVKGRTPLQRARDLIDEPGLAWGVVATLVFALCAAVLANWTREQPMIAVGDVMIETRSARVEFTQVDEESTRNAREEARQRVAKVFVADETRLGAIRNSIEDLPRTVAAAGSLDAIDTDTRLAFGLNAEHVTALKAIAADAEAMERWRTRARVLDEVLRRRPLLDRQSFRVAIDEGRSPEIELRGGLAPDEGTERVPRRNAVPVEEQSVVAAEAGRIATAAGFAGVERDLIVARLTRSPQATFTYDPTLWTEFAEAAAQAVPPITRTVTVGQKIFDRGDVLTQGQFELFARELAAYRGHAGAGRLWTRRLAVAGAAGVITLLIAGYAGAFIPRLRERPARIWWMTALLLASLVIGCVASVLDPRLTIVGVLAPSLLVAVLLCVAYDRRAALAIASTLSLLLCLALDRPIGVLVLALSGVALACAQLDELRDRRSLVRVSMVVGACLLVGAAFVGLVDRPITPTGMIAGVRQTARDAILAGMTGPVVGGMILFTLPFIERVFDITTGMTLVELRDPKQPLLREMQQRAPGTYNHSLNVASIAEAAAEAVGADSLLTYVGCLYHDIGKINKPQYFVENQSGGPNRHDKLSPAMSLLIIVGHVKDGMEMAREHGLPKRLRHFIEAHHGTTLVEYFYDRAKKKAAAEDVPEAPADASDTPLPDESDYRYPGPKPRTREVAIVMLADAVESATRTLAEPTPARIDALVRTLADKRLRDGQFDECALTLRDLRTICDSISKTVASIYHGRIQYASTAEKRKEPEAAAGENKAEPKPGDSEPPARKESA